MKLAPTTVVVLLAVGCGQKNSMQASYYTEHSVSLRWIPQDSGTSVSLRGVCACNGHIAWASGAEGTCLRTIDGGETWQTIHVPGAAAMDFRDIHAADAETAWLLGAGEESKIYFTADHGRHWVEQYVCTTPGAFFDAIAFWDAKRGIAFSDPVAGRLMIITTSDGGDTWNEIDPQGVPPALPGEHGFAASGTCLIVRGRDEAWIGLGGPAARVFRSIDAGRTWSVAATPMLRGNESSGVFSLAFTDARHGIAVGGDYQNPDASARNAAVSSDGGVTWTLVDGAVPNGYRSAVAYIPSGGTPMLVAVGLSGSDYSVDGGRNWRQMGTAGYHSVSFAADGAGWAVGADGRIAKFSRRRRERLTCASGIFP